MYNNNNHQPGNPTFPPSGPGPFASSNTSQHFNNSIWSPSFNEQNTFAQPPLPFSPYQPQEPGISPGQQRQPDLQRFNKKQTGSLTSRMASLQMLRHEVQQQGIPTRSSSRALQTQGDFGAWFKTLNGDMKAALVSVSLLLVLLLSVGVFALAGGFQSAQGQSNPNTSPSSNPAPPWATSTSTPTSTATPTSTPIATATAQATTTATDPASTAPTPQPVQQQPVNTPQPQPTKTPVPVPTPTSTPIATPTPNPTITPVPTILPTSTPTP